MSLKKTNRTDVPKLRMETDRGIGNAAADAPETDRRPLALNRLDTVSLLIFTVALILAPLVAVGFTTPTFPFGQFAPETAFDWVQLVGVPLLVLLSAIGFLVMLVREWKRPVATGGAPGLTAAAALFAVWCGISAIRSPQHALNANALAFLAASMVLGGGVARLGRNAGARVLLLVVVALAGGIVGAIGVRQYVEQWHQGNWYYRTFSTFINPDFLAGYLLITIPVTLGLVASLEGRAVRLCVGLSLVLQSATLLLSGSRAGAAVMVLTAVVWLLLTLFSGAARLRPRQVAGALGLLILGALPGAAPLLNRVVSSRVAAPVASAAARAASPPVSDAGQTHSGEFRKTTWQGTLRMATANPVFGRGIGSFVVTYPQYAITGFTTHAHNGFLQLAGETGFPGLASALACLAAPAAFGLYVLQLRRRARAENPASDLRIDASGETDAILKHARLAVSDPVIAGLLASVIAFLLSNLADSNAYIAASLLTLCAVCALLIAVARDVAPLAATRPAPLGRGLSVVGGALVILLLYRVGSQGGMLVNAANAANLLNSGMPPAAALEPLRNAVTTDPLDPEPRLALANVYGGTGDGPAEVAALKETVRVAPIGRAYYRLAQALDRVGDHNGAINAMEFARINDPHNVQTLRVLADMMTRTGRASDARRIYLAMEALETGPYGRVRAMPELVESDFAWAHLGMAQLDTSAGRKGDAIAETQRALAIFRAWWAARNVQQAMTLSPTRRKDIADTYDITLVEYARLLRAQNRTTDAAAADAELRQVRAERSQEENAAGAPAP